eukprot:gene5602-biopygen2310
MQLDKRHLVVFITIIVLMLMILLRENTNARTQPKVTILETNAGPPPIDTTSETNAGNDEGVSQRRPKKIRLEKSENFINTKEYYERLSRREIKASLQIEGHRTKEWGRFLSPPGGGRFLSPARKHQKRGDLGTTSFWRPPNKRKLQHQDYRTSDDARVLSNID